jgi:photosystem II stability/assembly factor-like uncharacterized protein
MTLRSTMVLLACALAPALVAYRAAPANYVNPPPPRAGPVLWAEPERDSAELDLVRRQPRSSSWPPALRALATGQGGLGLAVGDGNRAWRTEDGGHTWTVLPGVEQTVYDVDIRGDGVALVAALSGRILRLLAGDAEWTEVRPAGDGLIYRLTFVGERTVFGAGVGRTRDDGFGGLVVRSDDSGETWTELDVPEQWWNDVAFIDEQHGWLVGGAGVVMWTDDGGATWSPRPIATDETIRSVHAFDAVHALVAGSGGVMFRTRDRGRTWVEIDNGTGHHLRRVAFLDAMHGVSVGLWGTVLRTDDGGQTWNEENSGTQAHLYDVSWSADAVPIVVGFHDTILLGGAR